MAYQKHELLGIRKTDGGSPRDAVVKAPVKTSGTMPDAFDPAFARTYTSDDHSIARGGSPKVIPVPKIHDGMHARGRDGTLIVGSTHTTTPPDASSQNPLDPEPPSKRTQTEAAKPVIGQRSRVGETYPDEPGVAHRRAKASAGQTHGIAQALGQRVLDEAVRSGSTELPHERRARLARLT